MVNPMLNRVILIGRMACDPELKYTQSGIAVATFRIAVNRPKAKDAEKAEADFITIVAWRQSAEFTANYLTKGRLIAVEGRLQSRSWVSQDGTKRQAVEVVADNIRSLEPAKSTQGSSSDAENPAMLDSDAYEDPFAE